MQEETSISLPRVHSIAILGIQYKRDETVAEFNIADNDTVVIEAKDFITNGWILSQGGAATPSFQNNENSSYVNSNHVSSNHASSSYSNSTNYSTSTNYSSSYKDKSCEYCRQYRPIKYRCQCNTV